tara:strand:- start:232584 stop:232997 length:414 start_codon:yes stop_codon:yes gene_type:complete
MRMLGTHERHGILLRKRKGLRRRGAALLFALFVMTVVSTLAVSMLDTQTLRYASLRNTREWDEARYLAEAGLHDAFSRLEQNIDWREGISTTEFPLGSGHTYSATVTNGPDASVLIHATGTAGNFRRKLVATIKHGG